MFDLLNMCGSNFEYLWAVIFGIYDEKAYYIIWHLISMRTTGDLHLVLKIILRNVSGMHSTATYTFFKAYLNCQVIPPYRE